MLIQTTLLEVDEAEQEARVAEQTEFFQRHYDTTSSELKMDRTYICAYLSPLISQTIPVLMPPPSILSRDASPVVNLLSMTSASLSSFNDIDEYSLQMLSTKWSISASGRFDLLDSSEAGVKMSSENRLILPIRMQNINLV